jgi:hypothetical protein
MISGSDTDYDPDSDPDIDDVLCWLPKLRTTDR